MDALQLRLRGLAFALNALLQIVLRAQLFFQPGNLFAQHRALVADVLRELLLLLFIGSQGMKSFVGLLVFS